MAHALNRAPPEELLVKDHDGRVGSNVDAAADAKPREYPRPALKQTKKKHENEISDGRTSSKHWRVYFSALDGTSNAHAHALREPPLSLFSNPGSCPDTLIKPCAQTQHIRNRE